MREISARRHSFWTVRGQGYHTSGLGSVSSDLGRQSGRSCCHQGFVQKGAWCDRRMLESEQEVEKHHHEAIVSSEASFRCL